MVSGTQAVREQTAVRIPWTQIRLSAWTLALMLIVITFATFASVLRADFVDWDDREMIFQNPFLNPVTAGHTVGFWTHVYLALYTPLTYTAYALLAFLGGGTPHPIFYHAANLLLHIASSCLVFVLGRRLTKNDWAAWAGALLFALHPIQVEPVAWAGSMDTLLAGFLSLAALQQYLVWIESKQKSRWRYITATLLYILALCAKPSAVVVPLIAWILGIGLLRQPLKQTSLVLTPWVGIAIIWVLVTRHVQIIAPEIITPLWQRPIIAGDAIAFYVAKLVFPWPLGINYGRSPTYLFQHHLYLTGLVPIGLAILLWQRRKQQPWLWVSASIFTIALLPTSGIIPFAYQLYSTVADRYLYLAMLGPSLGLAFGLGQSQTLLSKRIFLAATSIGLIICTLISGLQVRSWNNSIVLFTHAVSVNPQSASMHYNLGNVLREAGKFPEAIEQYQSAILLMPYRPDFHSNLASAYVSENQIPEAISEYRSALAISPNFTVALNGLAMTLHNHPEYTNHVSSHK